MSGQESQSPRENQPLRQTLSAYEIVRTLATDAMGRLLLARQTSLARDVYLRVLKRELGADPKFADRFQALSRVLARLEHPRVVRVIDRGCDEGSWFLVMTAAEGRSLAELCKDEPPDEDEAWSIIADVGAALQHAHGMGILHQDLRPEHIVVDAQGRASVREFALSQLAAPCGAGAEARSFAAPEQSAGGSLPDARSDQYSLAALWFFLLTGHPPAKPGDDPSVEAEDVPAVLGKVVQRALARDPAERFESVEEFLRAAGRARRLGSVPGKRSSSSKLAAYKREPGPLGAAVTTVAILLAIYLALVLADRNQEAQAARALRSAANNGTNGAGGGHATQVPSPEPKTSTPNTTSQDPGPSPSLAATSEELWAHAIEAGVAARWNEAAQLYEIFGASFGEDPRAARAADLAGAIREYQELEQEARDREELRQYYDVHRLLADFAERAPEDAPFRRELESHAAELAALAAERYTKQDEPGATLALEQGRFAEALERLAGAEDCRVAEIEARARALAARIDEAQARAREAERLPQGPGKADPAAGGPAAGGGARQGEPGPGVLPGPDRPEWTREGIIQYLRATRADFKLNHQPVEILARLLERDYKLPCRVDPAFDRLGIKVHGRWRDRTLADALDDILTPLDLKLVVLKDGLLIQDKPKKWIEVQSRHYRVKTDLSRELAEQLGREMDRMFREYTQRFRFRTEIREKLDLTIYSRLAEFRAETGQPTWIGIYRRSGTKKDIAAAQELERDVFTNTLYHEGLHQFLDFYVKDPPTWLNEGLACYFGPSRFEDGVFHLGLVDENRLWAVNAAYNSNTNLPLKDLVAASWDGFHDKDKEGLYYAESWLLMHYLVNARQGRHRPVLSACINEMAKGRRVDFDKIIGDYAALEADVRAYAKQLEEEQRGR